MTLKDGELNVSSMKETIYYLYINQFILFESMENWNNGKLEDISNNLTSCFDFDPLRSSSNIPFFDHSSHKNCINKRLL